MVDLTQIDPADRTPGKVLDGMLMAHTPYQRDECIPCGAVIKMGFFFDAFGRHRDHDDPSTSRYSNICRLWEAHRNMQDRRRQQMPNHFWYRFYYSGLGTELNEDAANSEIVSAAVKTAMAIGKSAARATLYDLKKNPLKAGWSVAKGAFVGIALDSISQVRDDAAVARLFGTGVEDRLHAALKQFEAAHRDAKSVMNKVQRIEVSVFGADRGGVLARAFVNELVRKYKRRSEVDLAIDGDTIEIRFLGLLDAVSSLIAENKLLEFMPGVNMIKQNYGDQPLGVPEAVRKCVHFAAAHELRFYQRLDSLEKTHGDQYLYPGSSEDITGGAPPGSTGFRAELQRVALRDMLNEALMAGSAVDTIEELKTYKSRIYERFTLAQPISDGSASYKIPDLINAYRFIVPREKGLNFHAHMQVFLHWLAVRYRSPAFRTSVTDRTDGMKLAHQALVQQRADAEAAYQAERHRSPIDHPALGRALADMQAAQDAERESLRSTVSALANPVVSVWERIGSEAAELTRRHAMQAGLKESADRVRRMGREGVLPHGVDMAQSVQIVEASLMSPETASLVQAWQDGADGKKPLPPQVMALFDLLVHDTLLTSWHDHILSPTLYFQTRATDTFGTTDFKEEAKRREAAERNAQRVDQLPKADEARAGMGL